MWDNPLGAGAPLYDALSGDSSYFVTLNGTDIREMKVPVTLANGYCTIEDLIDGRNVVGVSVMDKAGNRGPERRLTLLVDTDTPSVSITGHGDVRPLPAGVSGRV